MQKRRKKMATVKYEKSKERMIIGWHRSCIGDEMKRRESRERRERKVKLMLGGVKWG